MGKYINHTPNGPLKAQHKADDLIKVGAELLFETPKTFEDNLICVVDNGTFEAAAYVQDERDLSDFSDYTTDYRDRVWLKWDKAKEYAR